MPSIQTFSIGELYKSARVQEIEQAAIEMEANGFAIDSGYFIGQAKVAQRDLDTCLSNLRRELINNGINSADPDRIWTSPVQLVQLLHDRLRLPPSPYWFKGRVNIDAGERKTDRTALEWVLSRCVGSHAQARGIVEGVMEFRRIGSSLKYLTKLPTFVGVDGFVHPVCGPAGDEDDRVGAITGRFGMKLPEGQQIPRDKKKDLYHIRKGFIAPPGQLLVVRDYTALEVVIMANVCDWMFGDDLLLELTAPGQDIHAYNSYNIFGRLLKWRTPSGRPIADYPDQKLYKTDPELAWYRDNLSKPVWYKLQYGGTVHGFATSLKDEKGEPIGKSRAEEIVDALYEAVPSIPKWTKFVSNFLRQHSGICSLDGRWVDYTNLINKGNGRKDEKDWAFQSAVRKAQNFPMQASGAGIIGVAMADSVGSPELQRLGAKLELQVHDELRWRCPEQNASKVASIADEIMTGAFPFKNLRTSGGIGINWEEAK